VALGLGWLLRARDAHVEPNMLHSVRNRTLAADSTRPTDGLSSQLEQMRRSSSGATLREALVSHLATTAHADPARAVQEALALSDAEGRAEALHECLPHWLSADKEAARAFLLAHIAELPLELAQAVVRDSAAHDPQLALALAQQLHVGARPRAVHDVFVEWAGTAPRAAAEAASQLLEADGQLRVVGEVARIWAEQTPAEAERWAAALDTPALRREALQPVVASWATQDPAAAAGSLEQLPDEGYKQRLIDTVATHWASRDAEAARSWVAQLSSPTLREAGATALVASLLEREPARAASWALELGRSASSDVVEKTLTSWVARDPQAALAWAHAEQSEHSQPGLVALVSERVRMQDPTALARFTESHTQPE
jgi:hypothetical protein